jgi:PIN domain-containing protein
LTFYFDRNFGKRFPEVIRTARPPFSVEFHDDPKNKFKFSQQATDDEWLAKVAAEGWIVFSHDRKFHTLLPEISAIKQYKAGCFYLPGASLPTWEKMCCFMRAYDGIKARIGATQKPLYF